MISKVLMSFQANTFHVSMSEEKEREREGWNQSEVKKTPMDQRRPGVGWNRILKGESRQGKEGEGRKRERERVSKKGISMQVNKRNLQLSPACLNVTRCWLRANTEKSTIEGWVFIKLLFERGRGEREKARERECVCTCGRRCVQAEECERARENFQAFYWRISREEKQH